MDPSSGYHRPWLHQCNLRRWRMAAYDCVRTKALSLEAHWRTDTLSHWSQSWLAFCAELESSRSWIFGMSITSSEFRNAMNTTLHFAPSMGSSNTKLCCLDWETHQLHIILKSPTVYSLLLMTLVCTILMIYWYTRPLRWSTKHKYKTFAKSNDNLDFMP